MKSRIPVLLSLGRIAITAAAVLCAGAFASAQNVQPVYKADFANSAGQGRSLGSVGWVAYTGATATVLKTASSLATVSPGEGTDGASGYIWSSFKSAATPLLFTQKKSIEGLSLSAGKYQISFDAVQQSNVARVQVAIELNSGDWYVSDTEFTPARSGDKSFDGAEADKYHFVLPVSLDASAWKPLTLKPDAELAIGPALSEPLSAQDVITNIGLLLTNKHGSWAATVRLDNLQIGRLAN